MKWQSILAYGGTGTISVFLLISLITNLSGISDVKHSGDITCGTECESFVNFTSSYWEFCFENGGNEDVVYRKTTSPRLWINLNKISDLVPTQPQVEVNLQVPTFGNKWRDIKDGDCLKRTTASNPLPIRLRILGHKEEHQTVKWSFNLNHWSSEGISIDPLWIGIGNEVSTLQRCKTTTEEISREIKGKEIILINNTFCFDAPVNKSCKQINVQNRTQNIVAGHFVDLVNTTSCVNDGLKVGNRVLNSTKYGWLGCAREGNEICCEAPHQSNGNGKCESGEGYKIFYIDDLSKSDNTVSKTQSIKDLMIE